MLRLNGKKVALGVTSVAMMWASACVLCSYHIRWEAEECSRIFGTFRTGTTTIEEATRAMNRFSRFREMDGAGTSFGDQYSIQSYVIKNDGRHLLGLFDPTYFQVTLSYDQDGFIREMSASLSQMPFRAAATSESIVYFQRLESLRNNSSGISVDIFDPPVKMFVFLSPQAPNEIRKAAYGYDLSCFTAVHRCQTIYRLLPTVRHYITK